MAKVRPGWLIAVFVTLCLTAPAAAQEDPSSTTTTSTTVTEPPTTTTATTAPGTTETTVAGETTTTTAPPEDPAAGGDAPSELVPDVDITVPPREITPNAGGFYGGQGSFAAYPGRLVRVTARSARSRASETQAALDLNVGHLVAQLDRQARILAAVNRLAEEEQTAIAELEGAQVELELRAADAYVRGNAPMEVLLSSGTATDYLHRRELLQTVLEEDAATVDRWRIARRAVDAEQEATAAELADATQQVTAGQVAVAQARLEHELAARELAVFVAGGSVVIHGFTFPVADPHQFGDSFGAPRMTGTEFEHWHEGTDIFAPSGTELPAAERGVITRMGTNVLGGITVWLKGESGVSYYYAHLSAYAPGIHVGLVVEPATVLGYVGNTGNARTTPAHLHFEIHPGGGAAINPFPILRVADGQEQPEPIRLGR